MKQPNDTINGREYSDIIVNQTTVHFDLWDRIKILFGKIPTVTVEIYCEHVPNPVHTDSKVYVPPFRLFKPKTGLVYIGDDNVNTSKE